MTKTTRCLLLFALLTPTLFAQVPGLLNYQGRVAVGGTNFTGTGQFKFALVAGSGGAVYWSSGASAVALPVSKGLYSVLLGDTSVPNMGTAIPAGVFTNSDVRLRVWFNSGAGLQQLTPDQRIAAAGYALVAARAETLDASGLTGSIADARLSANVTLRDAATNTFSGSLRAGAFVAGTNGSVGIGTATPSKPLVVQKRSAAEPAIMIGGGFAGGPRLQTYGLSDDPLAWMGLGADMAGGPYEHSLYFPYGPAASGFQSIGSYDGTTYSEKLRVTAGGSVGIGTATPAEKLDVAGALKLGTTANPSPAAGTIRWTGTDFQGFNGQQWLSMTAPTPAGMVLVPGGTFTLGSAAFGEVPEHQVTLSSFCLARCEVTYALWYIVRQWALANGYLFQNPGREGNDGTTGAAPTEIAGSEPVTYASWRDSIVWCNARSEKEGLVPVYTYTNVVIRDSRDSNATACDNATFNTGNNGYRLPTEAEWEYAARYIDGCSWTPGTYLSGSGFSYSNAPGCDAVAWFWQNSSNTTHTAGSKKANQLGLFDMSGNIAQFCWDRFATYDSAAVTNPVGPVSGTRGLYRGGAAFLDIHAAATARRTAASGSHTSEYEGFRCARNAQ